MAVIHTRWVTVRRSRLPSDGEHSLEARDISKYNTYTEERPAPCKKAAQNCHHIQQPTSCTMRDIYRRAFACVHL
jgi:hypothetical protein